MNPDQPPRPSAEESALAPPDPPKAPRRQRTSTPGSRGTAPTPYVPAPPTDSNTGPSVAGAIGPGATGVGIGTLFAYWATTLPDGQLKTISLLTAPVLTVITTAIGRATVWVASGIYREFRHFIRVWRIKKTLLATLNNKYTSDEHKAQMKAELEELERLDIRFQKDALKTSGL